MRSMKSQRTLLTERHGDLGDLRARSVELCASQHAPAERRTSPVLTPRQRDVAALLVGTGLSYKQIAARLELSEGTVRTHTERIYRALGVHSRPELTVALLAPGRGYPPAPLA
ncbi:response regulator transcription factor [Sorangium sp. So ce385]|uniref:response regulator transcription factor n=1 Tax=Sorangium sp. So ce385 TaxID=3133308 RepID=UPI003F5BE2E1